MFKLTMTIKELCNCLGIGRTKAYELIKDGELDSFKVGRRTLVTAYSVMDFVERGLRVSVEQAKMPPRPPVRLSLVPTDGSHEKW